MWNGMGFGGWGWGGGWWHMVLFWGLIIGVIVLMDFVIIFFLFLLCQAASNREVIEKSLRRRLWIQLINRNRFNCWRLLGIANCHHQGNASPFVSIAWRMAFLGPGKRPFGQACGTSAMSSRPSYPNEAIRAAASSKGYFM